MCSSASVMAKCSFCEVLPGELCAWTEYDCADLQDREGKLYVCDKCAGWQRRREIVPQTIQDVGSVSAEVAQI